MNRFRPRAIAGARVRALLAAGFAAAAMHGAALAAATDTRFDPGAQLAGTRLQLNGTGTRFKAVFKVYDMGLYTPRKVGTPEELLALPGPKRLQFTALRELSSGELGRLFIKGMSENSARDITARHTMSMMQLVDIFSRRSKIAVGESFALDYVPGKGTQFVIQGQPQGDLIGDAEFFAMVLGIWFGPAPADRALKEALLGRERETQ